MATSYTDQITGVGSSPTPVDAITGSGETVAYKAPCRVATTGNVALSGVQSIDGVTVAADDRVLVKAQTDETENGIYIVQSSAWFRARDFDSNRDITKGTRVTVIEGSTLAGKEYQITTSNPISLGTDNVTFAETLSSDAGSAAAAAEAAQLAAEAAQSAAEAVLSDPDLATVISMQANIATVAARDADIGTVAARDSDIGTVADRDADIGTVAGIAANVATVAGISADVTTVAGIAADVTAVAADATDIGAVASNIADVSAVAANETNIDAVAANSTNINAVAANETNIDAVAGNATNINAVASNAADIDTVAGIAADVTTVAGIAADVTTVAGLAADIAAVPGLVQDAEDAAVAAASSAAGVNLPPILAGDAGKQLFVKGDESGYELDTPAGGAVDSVNGQTGVVVLDADDIDDTSTTNKFVTSTNISDWNTAYGWGNHASAGYLDSGDIGVSVQGYSANLAEWSGINPSANGGSLVSAADYAAMRALLDLEPGTDVQAYDADLTSWAGVARASGFDTFTATPTWSNFLSLVTGEPTFYTSGGTDVAVADGGTGRSSHTAYAVLCGGTTSTGAQQSIASVGTSGQVLTSNGAGALPTFQDAAAGSGWTEGSLTTASGTAIDVPSLPSGIKEIIIDLTGLSTSGTSHILVQLGDSGGIEPSGYASGGGVAYASGGVAATSTAGFIIYNNDGGKLLHGQIVMRRVDGNTWVCSHSLGDSGGTTGQSGGGTKTLSAVLDRFRITTVSGTPTFDAGSYRVSYRM